MDITTIILIILSFVTALVLALFQYVFKVKGTGSKKWLLTGLRTLSLFLVFLLLINPKFERVTLMTEPPNLVVALDNSSSMMHLGVSEQAKNLLLQLKNNSALNEKYNLSYYKFGTETKPLDSLDFKDSRTDFARLINSYSTVYSGQNSPMILVTDGNQTYGNDVSYEVKNQKNQIFPIILGDTTAYEDLMVERINHNRYAFHKNKFEIEIFTKYSGEKSVNTKVDVFSNGDLVFSKPLNFNNENTSEIITTSLTAGSIGVQNYKVVIGSLPEERNTINNSKEFAVEVIDQTTNVAIVYSTPHPDIGMLRKSIARNDQRKVFLLQPSEFLNSQIDFQLIVLYQPDKSFTPILSKIFQSERNTLLISGTLTDWKLINSVQTLYKQEITNQEEFYQPVINKAYSPFIINDIDFEDYPPLTSEFGEITLNAQSDPILYKSVNANILDQPLLTTLELNNQKHGLLLGEGIWRWRAQNYIETGDFEEFDEFIGKLVQYLSSNKRRKRLVVDYESFYNSNDEIVISAQFFNKSYELDNTASLILNVENSEIGLAKSYPLLFGQSEYRVDLSGLPAGTYQFQLENTSERISQSGSFKVIPYNVEQQFLSPNTDKLKLIASNTGGQTFSYQSANTLIGNLVAEKNYLPIQREIREVSSIIEWYYLLGLIALTVSLEWFIRKYNGLI